MMIKVKGMGYLDPLISYDDWRRKSIDLIIREFLDSIVERRHKSSFFCNLFNFKFSMYLYYIYKYMHTCLYVCVYVLSVRLRLNLDFFLLSCRRHAVFLCMCDASMLQGTASSTISSLQNCTCWAQVTKIAEVLKWTINGFFVVVVDDLSMCNNTSLWLIN